MIFLLKMTYKILQNPKHKSINQANCYIKAVLASRYSFAVRTVSDWNQLPAKYGKPN